MDWVLGLCPTDGELTHVKGLCDGEVCTMPLTALLESGLPEVAIRRRLLVEGEFANLLTTSASFYWDAMSIAVPKSASNQHDVFCYRVGGVHMLIPALVLMRAFFKPVPLLLPKMFTPANVDQVSFVDYGSDPVGCVIYDAEFCSVMRKRADGTSKDVAIRWLQLSESARRTAQSVHRLGRAGRLSVSGWRSHLAEIGIS